MSFVVSCCLLKYCLFKEFIPFLSVFRLRLIGRAWEPAPTTIGISKIWTFHPKFFVSFVFSVFFVVLFFVKFAFFRLFRCSKIYFTQISPTKKGTWIVKILDLLKPCPKHSLTFPKVFSHGWRRFRGKKVRSIQLRCDLSVFFFVGWWFFLVRQTWISGNFSIFAESFINLSIFNYQR